MPFSNASTSSAIVLRKQAALEDASSDEGRLLKLGLLEGDDVMGAAETLTGAACQFEGPVENASDEEGLAECTLLRLRC